MSPTSSKVTVDVEGRTLTLTNLEKVLYPETGFTKGQVLDYYSRIAPVLLPHLAGRPLTLKRYPNGVEGHAFFEKNAPSHQDWVRTVTLPAPGSTKDRETIDYVVVEELATLIWVAQLASLELHVPQWRVGPRGGARDPDLLVLDLDPGPPATVVECCQVALLVRDRLEGADVFAKTSGSKGLQLALRAPDKDTSAFAHRLAEDLEKASPSLVVSKMAKQVRGGKVFVDWSQNNRAKTTICVYSLRARALPTVSTPVTWDEVAECAAGGPLRFTAEEVLFRVEEHGDLWADLA